MTDLILSLFRFFLLIKYDTIITDFNADGGLGKQYYIRTYGGARHCQFWCNPDG